MLDHFDQSPDPANPGWNRLNFQDDTIFNGEVLQDDDRVASYSAIVRKFGRK